MEGWDLNNRVTVLGESTYLGLVPVLGGIGGSAMGVASPFSYECHRAAPPLP